MKISLFWIFWDGRLNIVIDLRIRYFLGLEAIGFFSPMMPREDPIILLEQYSFLLILNSEAQYYFYCLIQLILAPQKLYSRPLLALSYFYLTSHHFPISIWLARHFYTPRCEFPYHQWDIPFRLAFYCAAFLWRVIHLQIWLCINDHPKKILFWIFPYILFPLSCILRYLRVCCWPTNHHNRFIPDSFHCRFSFLL